MFVWDGGRRIFHDPDGHIVEIAAAVAEAEAPGNRAEIALGQGAGVAWGGV